MIFSNNFKLGWPCLSCLSIRLLLVCPWLCTTLNVRQYAASDCIYFFQVYLTGIYLVHLFFHLQLMTKNGKEKEEARKTQEFEISLVSLSNHKVSMVFWTAYLKKYCGDSAVVEAMKLHRYKGDVVNIVVKDIRTWCSGFRNSCIHCFFWNNWRMNGIDYKNKLFTHHDWWV